MTETNQTEALYETDAGLSENIDDLVDHGYDIIHTDDINIVAIVSNGHEYRHMLKAVGIEPTDELVSHLKDTHHDRAREILPEDEYAQASGSAQIVVVEK
jgi:hypothetical protein